MKNIVSKIGALLVYFCVATVIGQIVLAGVFVANRPVDGEKVQRIMAVLYDVKEYPLVVRPNRNEQYEDETPSPRDVIHQRTIAELDMTLKENAIDKGLSDMRFLRARLDKDDNLFKRIKAQFDEEIKQQEKAAIDEGVRRLQRNIAAMSPKAARDTLLQMIDKQSLKDVVNVLSSMPLDKQRKIVSEFKGPGEKEVLQDIIREMLIGDVATIENAQKSMNAQFGSKRRK